MIEYPYFIMKSSLPSGDYAQLFVPSSIDRDSLDLLRKLIDLQLGAVERRIERRDAIEAALASPQAPVSPDEKVKIIGPGGEYFEVSKKVYDDLTYCAQPIAGSSK